LRSAADLATCGPCPDADLSAGDDQGLCDSEFTPSLASLIDRTNPTDPIALQFVPSSQSDDQPEELPDPIGDKTRAKLEGVVRAIRIACC